MKVMIVTVALLSSFALKAFILIDENYRLANADDVKVYISSEGCRANGISDDLLSGYIEEAIDDYWNTVPESILYLKFEGVSGSALSSNPASGTIMIGCGSLSAGIAGVAQINFTSDGCRVTMSSAYSGSSAKESFMGTLIHELGHCVGLHHSDDTASVMTYNATAYVQPAALSRDDKDGVAYLYPYEGKGKLFGSCSVISSEGNVRPHDSWLTILFGFLAIVGLRRFFKRA